MSYELAPISSLRPALSTDSAYTSNEIDFVHNFEVSEFSIQTDATSLGSSTAPLLEPSASRASTSGFSDHFLKPSLHRKKTTWQTYYQGWHVWATVCAVITGAVFIINTILTIWASRKYGVNGGLGTIFKGSCKRSERLSLWLHLAINILSSALLSASNYCMQCLSSPTRGELDKAHRRHIWLDIGVPSVRNIWRISRSRMALWFLLAFSSIPLHLLYNSAVFSALSAREYDIFAVSPGFANGSFFNETAVPADFDNRPCFNGNYSKSAWNSSSSLRSQSSSCSQRRFPHDEMVSFASQAFRDIKNGTRWQRLEKKDCIQQYGTDFVSTRGDVLVVSSFLNDSFSVGWISSSIPTQPSQPESSYGWICSLYPETFPNLADTCVDVNYVLQRADEWKINTSPYYPAESTSYSNYFEQYGEIQVDHCLSQPVEEKCKLQFSLSIMIVVIICNFIKFVCMSVMQHQHRLPPLVTLGDALTSFLDDPDPTTQDSCLASKDHFRKHKWGKDDIKWHPKRSYWFTAASPTRWLVCNLLCLLAIIISGVMLGKGLKNSQLGDTSLGGLWRLGFGAVTGQSLVNLHIQGNSGLLATILIANAPQLILSFLYLTYNSLFTCMLLGKEWSDYAYQRKPLRVTSPIGKQRSTYRLQLPYSYGIPLLVLSGVLHWLVSQSIFLARITAINRHEQEDAAYSVSTCGYSCIAIITVIFLGSLALIFGNLNGFRRYRDGMPLVGSCSAAISAACHRPENDVDAAVLPVKWGAVEGTEKVGHCCFTSLEVTPPVKGQIYKGLSCGGAKRKSK
ncbi:MAG: hypothetical protein Q9167_003687 [Letrouitia subvulpina]